MGVYFSTAEFRYAYPPLDRFQISKKKSTKFEQNRWRVNCVLRGLKFLWELIICWFLQSKLQSRESLLYEPKNYIFVLKLMFSRNPFLGLFSPFLSPFGLHRGLIFNYVKLVSISAVYKYVWTRIFWVTEFIFEVLSPSHLPFGLHNPKSTLKLMLFKSQMREMAFHHRLGGLFSPSNVYEKTCWLCLYRSILRTKQDLISLKSDGNGKIQASVLED